MAEIRAVPNRTLYVRAASAFCRDQFQDVSKQVLCANALTTAPTPDEAWKRALCVGLGETKEEVNECLDLARDLPYEDARRSPVLQKRFTKDAIDQITGDGVRTSKLMAVLAAFAPEAPAKPPAPAPAIAPGPPRPGAPPPPTPTRPRPTGAFASSVLRCLKGAELPGPVLDVIVDTALEIDGRPAVEGDKLHEMCSEVRTALRARADLKTFHDCLCPTPTASLLEKLEAVK